MDSPSLASEPEKTDFPRDIPLACFRLASSLFAVDAMRIQEITFPCVLAPSPSSSRFIVGDILLRGNLIPVMDMRRRFMMSPRLRNNPGELIDIDVLMNID